MIQIGLIELFFPPIKLLGCNIKDKSEICMDETHMLLFYRMPANCNLGNWNASLLPCFAESATPKQQHSSNPLLESFTEEKQSCTRLTEEITSSTTPRLSLRKKYPEANCRIPRT